MIVMIMPFERAVRVYHTVGNAAKHSPTTRPTTHYVQATCGTKMRRLVYDDAWEVM
jgi:hypothetical protein